jgi:hypothetical protein
MIEIFMLPIVRDDSAALDVVTKSRCGCEKEGDENRYILPIAQDPSPEV